MNYLTADPVMMERLAGVMEPVEIRDPDGKVLGTFTPALSPEEEELYRKAAELFDPAELDRIEKEGGPVYTIEQVWEYIHSMEKPG